MVLAGRCVQQGFERAAQGAELLALEGGPGPFERGDDIAQRVAVQHGVRTVAGTPHRGIVAAAPGKGMDPMRERFELVADVAKRGRQSSDVVQFHAGDDAAATRSGRNAPIPEVGLLQRLRCRVP